MSNFMISALAVKQKKKQKGGKIEINMGCESPPSTASGCLPEHRLGNLEQFILPRSPFMHSPFFYAYAKLINKWFPESTVRLGCTTRCFLSLKIVIYAPNHSASEGTLPLPPEHTLIRVETVCANKAELKAVHRVLSELQMRAAASPARCRRSQQPPITAPWQAAAACH